MALPHTYYNHIHINGLIDAMLKGIGLAPHLGFEPHGIAGRKWRLQAVQLRVGDVKCPNKKDDAIKDLKCGMQLLTYHNHPLITVYFIEEKLAIERPRRDFSVMVYTSPRNKTGYREIPLDMSYLNALRYFIDMRTSGNTYLRTHKISCDAVALLDQIGISA